MAEGARFHGMIGGGGKEMQGYQLDDFYNMPYYHKIAEGSHMSMDNMGLSLLGFTHGQQERKGQRVRRICHFPREDVRVICSISDYSICIFCHGRGGKVPWHDRRRREGSQFDGFYNTPYNHNSANNYNLSSYAGGSITMLSVGDDSSVGSNESRTVLLKHPGLPDATAMSYTVGTSVFCPNRVDVHTLGEDALARVLMDPSHPMEILSKYQQ